MFRSLKRDDTNISAIFNLQQHTQYNERIEGTYEKILTQEEIDFLALDLFLPSNNPNSNWLSNRLESAHDVVLEESRVLGLLLSRILGSKRYRKAILIAIQNWYNLGDHVITFTETKMMKAFNLELIYVCYFPPVMFQQNCDYTNIPQNDSSMVVFIQGGGFLGDCRDSKCIHAEKIGAAMRYFSNNRVVFLPNGEGNLFSEQFLIPYRDVIAEHQDVHVMLRDECIYELAKKYFTNANVLLSPDIAFFNGMIRLNREPRFHVVWLERRDVEHKRHKERLNLPDFNILHSDWGKNFTFMTPPESYRVTTDYHEFMTINAILYLSQGQVIATDRLHGHLVSVLLNKTSIAIETRNGKIHCYMQTWHQSLKTAHYAKSLEEAVALIPQLFKDKI